MNNIARFDQYVNEKEEFKKQFDDGYSAYIYDTKDEAFPIDIDEDNLVVKMQFSASTKELYVYKFLSRKGIPTVIGLKNATEEDFMNVLKEYSVFLKEWNVPLYYSDKEDGLYFKLFYKGEGFKKYE